MVQENFQHIKKIISTEEKRRWGICIKCSKNIKADIKIGTNGLKNHVAHYTEQTAQPQPAALHEGQVSILSPQVQRDILAKFIIGANLLLNIGEHLFYLEFIKVFYLNYQGISTTRRDVLAYYNSIEKLCKMKLNKGLLMQH